MKVPRQTIRVCGALQAGFTIAENLLSALLVADIRPTCGGDHSLGQAVGPARRLSILACVRRTGVFSRYFRRLYCPLSRSITEMITCLHFPVTRTRHRLPSPSIACGPCYTSTDLEVIADNPRGNTGFLDIKTVEHRLPSKMEILPFKAAGEDRGSQVGCTLDGTLEVARAKGSIRVHVMHHDPARIMAVGGVVGITQGEKRTGPEGVAGRNVSHRIHDLAFGVPVGMSKGAGFGSAGQNPLAKSAFVSKEGAGQVRYSLKIVPISHMSIYGRETRSHTYSTNVGFLTEIDAMRAVTHSQQWLGVEFGYDFTPVMVRFTETRKSALEFVTSVCAIVGGIYTVSGLVVRGVNDISRKKHD
ncbi:unnamed protein product [Sphacelaria rigidula]